MHEKLDLSDETRKRLAPFEAEFERERKRLTDDLAAAEQTLAQAISRVPRESAEIDLALEQINQAQAELRRLTLRHFFDMEEQLDAEQAERLRQWTHDSLLLQFR